MRIPEAIMECVRQSAASTAPLEAVQTFVRVSKAAWHFVSRTHSMTARGIAKGLYESLLALACALLAFPSSFLREY